MLAVSSQQKSLVLQAHACGEAFASIAFLLYLLCPVCPVYLRLFRFISASVLPSRILSGFLDGFPSLLQRESTSLRSGFGCRKLIACRVIQTSSQEEGEEMGCPGKSLIIKQFF